MTQPDVPGRTVNEGLTKNNNYPTATFKLSAARMLGVASSQPNRSVDGGETERGIVEDYTVDASQRHFEVETAVCDSARGKTRAR
jgi:hypothetical protein